MRVNDYFQVSVSEVEAFEAIYSGKISQLKSLFFDDKNLVTQYNHSIKTNADSLDYLQTSTTPNCSVEDFHRQNQKTWFMPENYCPNLIEEIYNKCENEQQVRRVNEELELFAQHNMLDLLFYLKYLVDTMRANNMVWGVGRGSSVASYVLYLIGVHKIDSIKYNLDIREFLK